MAAPTSTRQGSGPQPGDPPGRRAVLIVNTRSRKGRRQFAAARDLLAARGVALDGAHAVAKGSQVVPTIAAAAEQGHRLIIVGGGDGTVSAAAGCLAHRDAALAILPLGTANSFARALGLPLDVEGAVDALVEGKIVDVDLGRLDGRYFANGAAIGLAATVGRTVPHSLKRVLGPAAYPLAALANLLRHRAFRCTLTEGAETVSFVATEIRVANGAYQGGVPVAEDAHPDSGELVVQAIEGPSRLQLVLAWVKAALRLPRRKDEVVVLRRRDFLLETSPRQHVSIDGEPAGRTPVRIAVARQALKLVVPRTFEERVRRG